MIIFALMVTRTPPYASNVGGNKSALEISCFSHVSEPIMVYGFTFESRFHSSAFFELRLWKFITRARTNWFPLMVVGESADRSLLDIDAVQFKYGGFTWCWGVEVVGGTIKQHIISGGADMCLK